MIVDKNFLLQLLEYKKRDYRHYQPVPYRKTILYSSSATFEFFNITGTRGVLTKLGLWARKKDVNLFSFVVKVKKEKVVTTIYIDNKSVQTLCWKTESIPTGEYYFYVRPIHAFPGKYIIEYEKGL